MRRWAALAVVLAASAGPARAQTPPDAVRSDLAASVQAYRQAVVDGDEAALNRLLADEFVAVIDGERLSRAEQIADLTHLEVVREPEAIAEPFEHVWNDGAVVGGTADQTGFVDGRPFRQRAAFVDVWSRIDGRWRLMFERRTRVD